MPKDTDLSDDIEALCVRARGNKNESVGIPLTTLYALQLKAWALERDLARSEACNAKEHWRGVKQGLVVAGNNTLAYDKEATAAN